jgi:DNA-binding Lrp family transcriptional regulator
LEGEEYVGGIASGRMLKAGGIAGYGIYVTTRRIIGAKSRKALWKGLAGAALGGVTGAFVGSKLSRDQNAQMIDEIEQKKDFEVVKENISRVEMKKPSFVHRGHMVISTTTGDPVKIILADGGDYKRLLELMQSFRPDALNII